ncbi:MAG: hypothetical protein V4757_07425 [Pseudomonadota bacterium]
MSNTLFISIVVVSLSLLVGAAKLLNAVQNNNETAVACRASGHVWLGEQQLCVKVVKP